MTEQLPPNPVETAQSLIEGGLHKSAELILSLYLTATSTNKFLGLDSDTQDDSRVQAMVLYGDCLQRRNQHKRAKNYYAMALRAIHSKTQPTSTRQQMGPTLGENQGNEANGNKQPKSQVAAKMTRNSNPFLVEPVHTIDVDNHYDHDDHDVAGFKDTFLSEISIKCAECSIALNDLAEAKDVLEEVPTHSRTLPLLTLLADVCSRMGEKRSAREYHEAILKLQPLSIESMLYLIQNDPSQATKYMAPFSAIPALKSYLAAKTFDEKFKHESALGVYKMMSNTFNGNVDLLIDIAESSYKQGKTLDSLNAFAKARRRDPNVIDGMDTYSALVHAKKEIPTLTALSQELLTSYPQHSSTYLILSRLWDCKGDDEKALFFVEKSIKAETQNAEAWYFKGVLLGKMGLFTEAVDALRTALKWRKTVYIYQAITECYMTMSRWKEAYSTASSCAMHMPQNAKAMALSGLVLSRIPNQNGNYEPAMKRLQLALTIDPECPEAIHAYTSLLLDNGKSDQAIQFLEEKCASVADESLYLKLAGLKYQKGHFDQARSWYNAALGLNPSNDNAKEGVLLCERELMKNPSSTFSSLVSTGGDQRGATLGSPSPVQGYVSWEQMSADMD